MALSVDDEARVVAAAGCDRLIAMTLLATGLRVGALTTDHLRSKGCACAS